MALTPMTYEQFWSGLGFDSAPADAGDVFNQINSSSQLFLPRGGFSSVSPSKNASTISFNAIGVKNACGFEEYAQLSLNASLNTLIDCQPRQGIVLSTRLLIPKVAIANAAFLDRCPCTLR